MSKTNTNTIVRIADDFCPDWMAEVEDIVDDFCPDWMKEEAEEVVVVTPAQQPVVLYDSNNTAPIRWTPLWDMV